MPREIERKFLLKNEQWRALITKTQDIQQGYLVLPSNKLEKKDDIKSSVRIRIIDKSAYLTIKSLEIGSSRDEFEYPIAYEEAQYMLQNLCVKSLISKKRHTLHHQQHQWVIDEFMGVHHPLIIAEIELQKETEEFIIPPWLGKEVTDCLQYYNTSLIQNNIHKS